MVSAMSLLSDGLSHLIHYSGFALALGASFAVQRIMASAREHSAAQRAGLEIAARKVILVELIGIFVAIFGGIFAIVLNPTVFGPWLHVKLLMVMILLVVSHLKMFRLARLVRERADGASEADCEATLKAARTLGLVDLAMFAGIMIVASLRFAIFGIGAPIT